MTQHTESNEEIARIAQYKIHDLFKFSSFDDAVTDVHDVCLEALNTKDEAHRGEVEEARKQEREYIAGLAQNVSAWSSDCKNIKVIPLETFLLAIKDNHGWL